MPKLKLLATSLAALFGSVLAAGNAMASATFNTLIDTPTELKVQWMGDLKDFNSASIVAPKYWDILFFDLSLSSKLVLGKTFSNWESAIAAQHDSVNPAHPHDGDLELGPVFSSYLSGKLGSSGFDAEKSPHNLEAWTAWNSYPTATDAHWDHYAFSVATNLDGTGTATLYAIHPVPEPESYAMLLAGLGILGTMVRRRQIR